MNVLILGGYGFVGSHIVERLALTDFINNIRVFARTPPPYHYDAEWFAGDFLDQGKLSEALVGMDAVVHCISTTVPATSTSDPIYDIKTNLVGTVELLRLMQKQGVHRLIFLSSGGTVYGDSPIIPVTEIVPLKPISSYGAVKVAIESYINIFNINSDIQSVIIRPSNLFGERQEHLRGQGIIATILNNIINCEKTIVYGDGTAVRDYLYVKDIALLVCNVLMTERCGIYNAGSGKGYSINELIESIKNAIGVDVPKGYEKNRGFDVDRIILDSTLAEEHFNWKASVSLTSGIVQQYNWLRRQFEKK